MKVNMYKVTVKGEASAYTEDGVDYKGSELRKRDVLNRTRNEVWKDKIDERLELITIVENMDEPKQIILDY